MASTEPRTSSSSRISPENFERLPTGPAGALSARSVKVSREDDGRRYDGWRYDVGQHDVGHGDRTSVAFARDPFGSCCPDQVCVLSLTASSSAGQSPETGPTLSSCVLDGTSKA